VSRRLFPLAAALLVVALTSCVPEPDASPTSTSSASASPAASEPGSTVPPTNSASPTPTVSATPDSEIERIVSTLGLTDFRFEGEADYIAQWGVGLLDGGEVRVYEFASEDDFLTYLDSVAPYGITIDDFVRVGLYAVAPTDRDQIEQIRAAFA
jgi:hypothetical protein